MKIVVLMGGDSAERGISISSGTTIGRALKAAGHQVGLIDTVFKDTQVLSNTLDSAEEQDLPFYSGQVLDVVRMPVVAEADVVFLAFHGGAGENGGVQSLLEMAGITYTGSGPLASALAMNKHVSKMMFRQAGVETASWIVLSDEGSGKNSSIAERVESELGLPWVVKPNAQGSTIGLTVVERREQLAPALKLAKEYDQEVIIEKYIPGRDLTVAILDREPLPVVEIIPKHKVYDYTCKYTQGMSQYVVPAEISPVLQRQISSQALRAYRLLYCKGYGRVDFRLSAEGELFCLEVNTLPGMTQTSLVPKAAQAAGTGFPELVDRIVKLAIQRTGSVP